MTPSNVIHLPNARLVDEATERIAMQGRLAQLRVLALKAMEADARAKVDGDTLEREMALSVLVSLAASDWRGLLP